MATSGDVRLYRVTGYIKNGHAPSLPLTELVVAGCEGGAMAQAADTWLALFGIGVTLRANAAVPVDEVDGYKVRVEMAG